MPLVKKAVKFEGKLIAHESWRKSTFKNPVNHDGSAKEVLYYGYYKCSLHMSKSLTVSCRLKDFVQGVDIKFEVASPWSCDACDFVKVEISDTEEQGESADSDAEAEFSRVDRLKAKIVAAYKLEMTDRINALVNKSSRKSSVDVLILSLRSMGTAIIKEHHKEMDLLEERFLDEVKMESKLKNAQKSAKRRKKSFDFDHELEQIVADSIASIDKSTAAGETAEKSDNEVSQCYNL